jgi:Tfp pilus assembly protein PilZ
VSSSALAPAQGLNINAGGIFIHTEQLLPVNAEVVVEFALPQRPQGIRCRCRVAWVNHPEWVKMPRLPAGMGVQFIDLPMSGRLAVESFLTDKQSQDISAAAE